MSADQRTVPPTAERRSRISDWWYLGFLVMLVYQPAFDPDSGAREWIASVAVAAVFVPFYLDVTLRDSVRRRWAPTVATVLAVLLFPFNGGSTVLLIYAAGFAGGLLPRRQALRWFAGLSLLTVALGVVSPLPMPFWLGAFAAPLVFIWVVGLATLEEAHRDRESRRLRVDNARIEQLATATERERLARDLHDLTGQSLTSIAIRAQLVQRLAARNPDRAVAEAAAIEEAAREVLAQIRDTLRGWRQVSVEDELDRAAQVLAVAGVALEVRRDADLHLAPSVEQALGLALREAITNVARHAAATRCVVRLEHVHGELVLEVADDGVGGGRSDGGGLSGMRDRIAALGGRVERAGSDGTLVTVAVPVQMTG